MLVAVAGAMVLGEWGEGASVVFLFALAQLLEARAMDRARGAIRALMDLAPAEALVKDAGGRPAQTPIDTIAVGEPSWSAGREFRSMAVSSPAKVREPGAGDRRVAAGREADGRRGVRGNDQRTRLPRRPGHPAPRATRRLRASIDLVERAQAQRAPSQTFVERFARVYTPACSWSPWPSRCFRRLRRRRVGRVDLSIAGPAGDHVSVRAASISTPVSVVSALAAAARKGVLIKGGAHLERLATFARSRSTRPARSPGASCASWTWHALDGVPRRTALCSSPRRSRCCSEHPIGAAIVAYARASSD